MTELSRLIFDFFQVRKSKKQKTEFIEFMSKNVSGLTVDDGGFGKGRNLVLGNVENAKVIFAAHYDTCAELPFPNLIMPKNIFLSLGYGLLICLPFLALYFLCLYGFTRLNVHPLLTSCASFCIFLVSYLGVFMLGKANRNTANDNTSGVISLIELMNMLTDSQKQRVAFVFFDNEENGLLGSAYFRGKYKKQLKNKLLVNLDCVSDGENIMLIMSKSMKKHEERLRAAFREEHGKTPLFEHSSKVLYPSDQSGFPHSIAVAALKKTRRGLLYMDKIHTKHDTVFDESNILYICRSLAALLENMGIK